MSNLRSTDPAVARLIEIAEKRTKARKPTHDVAPQSTISTQADRQDHPKSFVIVLSLPDAERSPNARPHYMTKAKLTRAARDAAAAICRYDLEGTRPNWRSASVKLDYYFATNRRRDSQNLIAWAKAEMDGLVDAGLLADDDQVTFLPVGKFIDSESPRLTITLTKENA